VPSPIKKLLPWAQMERWKWIDDTAKALENRTKQRKGVTFYEGGLAPECAIKQACTCTKEDL